MGGASAGSSSLVAKCIHVFVKVRRCIYSSGNPHTTTITLSSIVSDFLPPLAMTSPLEQAPDWLTRREYPPKFRFFNSRYWRVKVCSHQMRMIYMLSQCKHAKDNPAALFARMRRREWRELKNLNFGRYSQNDFSYVTVVIPNVASTHPSQTLNGRRTHDSGCSFFYSPQQY